MALIALSLNAVTNVVASIEDVANIAYRLIDFFVGVARIGPGGSGRTIPGSLLARIDRVVAS